MHLPNPAIHTSFHFLSKAKSNLINFGAHRSGANDFNRAGCIFPTDDADHVSRHQFPHALAPRPIGFFSKSHPNAAHVINRAILCEKDHKKWSPRLALPPRSQSSHGPCREVTSPCHKMTSPMPKQVITDVTSGDIATKISTSLKPRCENQP